MLIKKCAKCGKYIPYGKPYCPDCQIIIDGIIEKRKAERKRQYDHDYDKNKRNKRNAAFYKSNEWKMTAARYLQEHNYRCERCGSIATQVHHKRYLSTPDGWERRFDFKNLEALCLNCHNEEHKRFQKRKPRG
jgi:5-methylcytosine-specific restriction endonuclease McrA